MPIKAATPSVRSKTTARKASKLFNLMLLNLFKEPLNKKAKLIQKAFVMGFVEAHKQQDCRDDLQQVQREAIHSFEVCRSSTVRVAKQRLLECGDLYVLQLPVDYKDQDFASEFFLAFESSKSDASESPVPYWGKTQRQYIERGDLNKMEPLCKKLQDAGYPVKLVKTTELDQPLPAYESLLDRLDGTSSYVDVLTVLGSV